MTAPHRHPRAFTLVEMCTSMGVLAVLMAACGSVVMLATKSTTDAARTPQQLQAADTVTQMADDLTVATNFTQRTATAATFTVPDRLGLGAPQTVTYAWSGTAGDALKRTFNGGAATAVLAGVQSLNFDYATRLLGPAAGPAEQTVASHDTLGGTAKDYALSDKAWASQCFYPVLPAGAASWTLTHLKLMLKSGAPDQALTVSLEPSDGTGRPTGTVVASAIVYQSALSTGYEWIDVQFTGVSGLSPLQGLCVVLSPANGGKNLGSVQIDQALLNLLAGAYWSTSSNAGASWSAGLATTCARFVVYGTVP